MRGRKRMAINVMFNENENARECAKKFDNMQKSDEMMHIEGYTPKCASTL